MKKIGFLGLGVMGTGMAARLLDAGFPVTVWNRNAGRAEPLRARGAALAASPRDAAAGADVVIAMVADDNASRAVWTGKDGAIGGLRDGAVAVECSTLSPQWVTELAALIEARGASFLDAPVTGSKPQAANGEVLFLVGGDPAALAGVRDVLQPMSRDVLHMGPVASGARMKLVNNFMSAVQAVSLAEAIAFSRQCGLDPVAAMHVLTNGAPGSPLVKTVGARMMARDYAVNFFLRLMRKDVHYAADEAKRCGVELHTAAAALARFDQAIASGWGEFDFAAVAEAIAGRTPASDQGRAAGRPVSDPARTPA
jgi:3-hydroxyisobutyrate dehydrogenase